MNWRTISRLLPILLAALAMVAVWETRSAFERKLSAIYPEGQPLGRNASWTEARQTWFADASLDVAALQFMLGVVGVVGVGATVFYARLAWREAQRSADVANEALADARASAKEQGQRFSQQLNVSEESAKAAIRMADAIAASERAYVFLAATRVFGPNPKKRVLVWHNYGRTPAIVTKVQFACEPSKPFPDPLDPLQMPMPGTTIIPAGDDLTLGVANIDIAEENIQPGEAIYLYGQITYNDVHLIERRSWFCQMLGTDGFFAGALYQADLNGFE